LLHSLHSRIRNIFEEVGDLTIGVLFMSQCEEIRNVLFRNVLLFPIFWTLETAVSMTLPSNFQEGATEFQIPLKWYLKRARRISDTVHSVL